MDEKDFKKHLQDLVHGHHHPEEHDWSSGTNVRKGGEPAKLSRSAKSGSRAVKPRKRSRKA